MTRAEFIRLLWSLQEYIEGDRVTAEDDEAIAACKLLRTYAVEEMTEQDFKGKGGDVG